MENRECRADRAPEIAAPELPYLPQQPKAYRPGIGLIGCGGIAPYHLRAYQAAGYRVVALCDKTHARASACAAEMFPKAGIHTDYRALLDRPDIEVVDIATHPEQRVALIEAALHAGKHVLSQKPFVIDLDVGERLVALADEKKLKFAVNQNGRWAPHYSYMRQAIAAGLIGTPTAAHFSIRWDHNWTADTVFNNIPHLILYDFGIHWFDMMHCFLDGARATRVFASTAQSPAQRATPPMLAQVLIEFERAQGSLAFDADTRHGALDQTSVIGTEGVLMSQGPDLNTQSVTLTGKSGRATPMLQGDWFTNGFHGSMAELLCAIEDNREPQHSARHNLTSLALCFAALASADDHAPRRPGEIRSLRA